MKIRISTRQLELVRARKTELDTAVRLAEIANARLTDVLTAAADQDLTRFAGYQFGVDEEGGFIDLQEQPHVTE